MYSVPVVVDPGEGGARMVHVPSLGEAVLVARLDARLTMEHFGGGRGVFHATVYRDHMPYGVAVTVLVPARRRDADRNA